MEHGLGMGQQNGTLSTEGLKLLEDGIVMLIDPDMVLLRPLSHDFTNEEVIWIGEPRTLVVCHGFPIAQQDGYLANKWMYLNWTYITGLPQGKYIEPNLYRTGEW